MTEEIEKDAYDLTLDELAEELAEFKPKEKKESSTPEEERILAGFEDIERFYEQKKRLPATTAPDIFERLLAIRLEAIKAQQKCLDLLEGHDEMGILKMEVPKEVSVDELDDNELADLLSEDDADSDLFDLQHVRTYEERTQPNEIADRKPCKDFERFKRLFDAVTFDLKSGRRHYYALEGGENKKVSPGEFYVLNGQMAYVAEMGDFFKTAQNRPNARMRVIFANGTESNLLVRSFQRAMYGDPSARGISEAELGGLFGDAAEDFKANGTIYVLRSLSSDPVIEQHRDVIHKIGVTTTSMKQRLAGAASSPTYLMADVETVATYNVYGINPVKLEALLHDVFAQVQLDITVKDRFGKLIRPHEWYMVPLNVVDELITHIEKGDAEGLIYDPTKAALMRKGRAAKAQRLS